MAIGWQLPILTTTMGCRGYTWGSGELVVADDPDRFADHCLRLLDYDEASAARRQVGEVADSSPTLDENAARFRSILGM
jgi:hypothetical protein